MQAGTAMMFGRRERFAAIGWLGERCYSGPLRMTEAEARADAAEWPGERPGIGRVVVAQTWWEDGEVQVRILAEG